MNTRTALVLGGGVGGVVAANRLRKLLPKRDRVVLIDRESQHVFQPSLLWLVVGDRTASQIQRPLEGLRPKGIEVLRAEIERIDPRDRLVRAGGQDFTGDAILLSLGAELDPAAVPGLAAGGHDLYTTAGAEAARDALRQLRAGRIVILTAAPAYKCPAAPYEAAMLIEYDLRRRDVRTGVELDIYAAEPGPMGVAGPEVSAAVRQLVESKGIRYHPEHQVRSVDPDRRRLAFANGVTADYDLLLYVPPHRAPAVVREAGLVGDSGWVNVDRGTLETGFPGVYAFGDVTSIPLRMGKPLPKAGVFAHGEAEVVAANLANEWAGRGARRTFEGHGACFLEAGDGKAGIGSGDFFAQPVPQVKLRAPAWWWHWGKVAFERSWFWRWL